MKKIHTINPKNTIYLSHIGLSKKNVVWWLRNSAKNHMKHSHTIATITKWIKTIIKIYINYNWADTMQLVEVRFELASVISVWFCLVRFVVANDALASNSFERKGLKRTRVLLSPKIVRSLWRCFKLRLDIYKVV